MLYPFTFQPIFKERVWGGRNLERLYQKVLPVGPPIGESWEISDRPEGVSVIANGPLAGKTLRWLMEEHRQAVLGASAAPTGSFPVLIKILDAQETLSLQVHPPAAVAASMGGEPKTEMWFITDATPDASLYVGLKSGITRADFEERIANGTVADALHRLPVKAGDTIHAKLKVLEKRESSRADRGIMKRQLQVFNQRGEMVQDAVQAFLLKRKPV